MSENKHILKSYQKNKKRLHKLSSLSKLKKRRRTLETFKPMDYVNLNSLNSARIKTGISSRRVQVDRLTIPGNPNSFLATMDHFLTDAECEEVVKLMKDKQNNFRQSDDFYRDYRPDFTSVSSTKMEFKNEAQILTKLRRLVHPFLGLDKKNLHRMRSTLKHYDAKTSSEVGIKTHYDASLFTILITLNSCKSDAGGETCFNANEDVSEKDRVILRPVRGRAYWFRNMRDDSSCFNELQAALTGKAQQFRIYEFDIDSALRHQGMPVKKGEKSIAQFLVHAFEN